jgi:hypothetical protein
VDRRADVDRDLAREAVGILVDERAEGAEAGVVDEAGDADAATGDGVAQLRSDRWGRQVERDRVDGDAVPGAQVGRERFEPVGAPGDEHEVGAARRESGREAAADAGARAGDENGVGSHGDTVRRSGTECQNGISCRVWAWP